MVVAGIVWTVAGVNILRIGIDCWAQVSGGFVLMLLGAVAVFAALGVSIRRYELMPLWFIAPFYTGLSSALVLTGIRFLFSSKFWNRKSVV